MRDRRRVCVSGRAAVAVASVMFVAACATESHQVVATDSVASAGTPYTGPRPRLTIGDFQNHSPYMRGMFTTGEDHLGTQAKTILKTHVSQANRFTLADRDNMDEIGREAQISGATQNLTGAQYVLSGEVTE